MLKKSFALNNKLGLHARAAAKFFETAGRYASEITVIGNFKKANGKSIMDMMLLAAIKGTTLELQIAGEDEAETLAALEKLITDKFGEKE